MDKRILTQLEIFQRQEATMAILYKKLSKVIKDPYNRDIMEKLSEKEVQHYENAKAITGVSCKPYRYKIWGFFLIVRLFGLTFGVKLLENNGKEMAQLTDELSQIPELNIITEGEKNEKILIEKIEEEKLQYFSAVVLGMNDAIIEFTGMLAGFAFAFQKHTIVLMAGAIAGIAAAMSMGASEYMSAKTEENRIKPMKAAAYCFFTYLVTVVFLLSPFLFVNNVFVALGIALFIGVCIVGIFNFYYSVTKEEKFWKRFLHMAIISFTVAGISFLIGMMLKHFTGIQV